MPNEILSPVEENAGRDFSSVIKGSTSRYERAQAMQVGDYITIDPQIFARWVGRVLGGDPGVLENSQPIKLSIESISYRDGAKTQPDKIVVVSSNGVKKEVSASLFYSYGHVPQDVPYTASRHGGSGFGEKGDDPHSGGW